MVAYGIPHALHVYSNSFLAVAMKLLTEINLSDAGCHHSCCHCDFKGNECQLKQTEASRILKTKRTLGKNKPNSYGLVFFPNYKIGIVMS
jgi:hypothetical protein